MFKKSKIILALTLVLAMGLTLLGPVSLAAPDDAAEAKITKLVKAPINTNAPNLTFLFDVTAISINGDRNLKGEMPQVGPNLNNLVEIAFTDTMDSLDCICEDECTSNIAHYYLQSEDLFPGGTAWKYAGIYTYDIEEQEIDADTANGEVLLFSGEAYRIKVFVKEDGDDFIINHISASKIENVGEEETGEKVDPDDPGDDGDDGATSFSKMLFTSTFYRQNGGDGTNPLGAQTFVVHKEVAGEFSSRFMYFEYSITLKKNPLIPGSVTYRAYVLDQWGGIIKENLSNNVNGYQVEPGVQPTNAYYTFTLTGDTPTTFTFKLRHNEKFVFTNLHVGTEYSITETGAAGYKATATITTGGVQESVKPTADVGASLTIPAASAKTLYVGDKGINMASFLNETPETPEAGLNISDLPYYGLLLLGLAGLVTYVVVKARSRKNTSD